MKVYVLFGSDWKGIDVFAVLTDRNEAEREYKRCSPYAFCHEEEYTGPLDQALDFYQEMYYEQWASGTFVHRNFEVS